MQRIRIFQTEFVANNEKEWVRLRFVNDIRNQVFRKNFFRIRNFLLANGILLLTLTLVSIGVFRKKLLAPTSILFSVSRDQLFEGKSIGEFMASVSEKRFQAFYDTENLLIEVRSFKTIWSGHKNLTFDAPSYLASRCLRRKLYPALVWEVLKRMARFKYDEEINVREAKTYFFDYSFYKTFGRKNHARIDYITTNSSLNRLPSAFSNSIHRNRIMLWYSTNSKPLKHPKSETILPWNPMYICENVDLHLVWTNFDVEFLESLGIRNAHAVGPILFQPRLMAERDSEKFILTFFDITPFRNTNLSKSESIADFYSEKNAIKVLIEFGQTAKYLKGIFGNKIVFRIKPKREYSPSHSQLYQQKIAELSEDAGIEILDPYSNLYLTVSESDLVLSTPWSSPSVLAKELEVNSAFLSFSSDEWDIPTEYEGIKVIKSSKELTSYLLKKVQDKLDKIE